MVIHCPIAVKSGKRHPHTHTHTHTHTKLSVVYEFRENGSSVILDELNVGPLEKFWMDLVTNKLQNSN
jgi:hypothetical protein